MRMKHYAIEYTGTICKATIARPPRDTHSRLITPIFPRSQSRFSSQTRCHGVSITSMGSLYEVTCREASSNQSGHIGHADGAWWRLHANCGARKNNWQRFWLSQNRQNGNIQHVTFDFKKFDKACTTGFLWLHYSWATSSFLVQIFG